MPPYYEMLYRELIDFEKDLAGICVLTGLDIEAVRFNLISYCRTYTRPALEIARNIHDGLKAGIISREDVINIESADIMAAMGAAYCRRKETY